MNKYAAIFILFQSIEGYSSLKIKQLLKIHFRKISPEYAYNKCIFDSGDIATLLSDELTLANDDLIEHSHSLNELRESYGTRIWRLVSQLCVKSQKAFEMRLQNLTANGKQVTIDQKTAKKLSKIFFYPTENGKPSVKKTLIRLLYETVDVAYTVGSIQSLVGFGIGDIIVSLAFISQSAMNFILVDFPRFKIKLYDLNPEMLPTDLSLDLNDEERAILNTP